MEYLVVCPGSRSTPLAMAASLLEQQSNLKVFPALDERSASFLALGISTAKGIVSGVITTSGSAVANLLPAALEADKSNKSVILITADRPSRLKDCGSNQTVNQEEFLLPVCRKFLQAPVDGIHLLNNEAANKLIESSCFFLNNRPGPVHLNLAIEEPLHPSVSDQKEIMMGWEPPGFNKKDSERKIIYSSYEEEFKSIYDLDFTLPGVVIVGPWRGKVNDLIGFKESLKLFHEYTGWPIFADPLSGIDSNQKGLIQNWEFIISQQSCSKLNNIQKLRLGPLSSSRILENWLAISKGDQLLVSEKDYRKLDPLKIAKQSNEGFANSCKRWLYGEKDFKIDHFFIDNLFNNALLIDQFLDSRLKLKGSINEPALARWLPKLTSEKVSFMLSASSPIRDWLTFSGSMALKHKCFSFRGASGIDGTLSSAIGLSLINTPTILVTGDLALLHDTNGWLLCNSLSPPLLVLLIDNAGGGIFDQIAINFRTEKDYERLVKMPQSIDYSALASSYGIPFRQLDLLEELESALTWGLEQSSTVLIRVCTDPKSDYELRKEIREGIDQVLRSN